MCRMMNYIPYDSGLNINTQYLTKEVAFFLGGIYSAAEKGTSNGKTYWSSPVRYNFQYATEEQIASHYDSIKTIASLVNGNTVMSALIKGSPLDSGKNSRLPGFCTFFEATTLLDLIAEIPNLETALLGSPKDVQKAFILGVMDGRGTPDISIPKRLMRYLTLDCPDSRLGVFFTRIFNNYGFSINYNTSRDRLEGGRPREQQFRIKDIEFYMENIGYISPTRYKKLADVYDSIYGTHTEIDGSSFLPGLKYLTR